MNALDILRERGFIYQTTDIERLSARLEQGPVTFYVGFDPTGSSLHIGHLLPVMAMRWLQQAGHRPIAIVGGGTAMVGDPSGKSEARQLLTTDEIDANARALQPFNVNRLAQEGAMAALDDAGFLRRTRTLFRQGRAMIEAACGEMGLEYRRAVANFMLVKVGDGARVTAELMRRGVIVRPMGGYGLPQYIRVSYGTLAENGKFIAALRAVLGK